MKKLQNISFSGQIKAYKINTETKEITRLHIIDTLDFYKKNKTPDQFKTDLISLVTGTASPNIEITNIALSTNPDDITNNATSSLNISRLAVNEPTINNFSINYLHTFGNEIANTKKTTISTITSQTQFTVANITGFRVGDGLILKGKKAKIQGISGSTITLAQAFPITISVSDTIEQLICRVELLYDTGLTLDVGKLISVAKLETTKNSSEIIKVQHKINIFGT